MKTTDKKKMAASVSRSFQDQTAGRFVRIAGLTGKVYVPNPKPAEAKKHPCPDCHCCQMCGEERCRTCRGREVGENADRQVSPP